MLVELCLLICLIILLKIFVLKSRAEKLYNEFPGPRVYPIVGNTLEFYFDKSDYPEILKKLSFKYGKVYRVKLGLENFVCIRSPEDIEVVLSKVISKPPLFKILHPWIKQGLFTSSGEQWIHQKKVIAPAFNVKVLETFVPIMEKNAKILVKNLMKRKGEEFDVIQLISPCSLDIICETAMGLQINAQSGENAYLNAVNELTEIMSKQVTSVIQQSVLFQFMKAGKRHKELISYLHGVTDRIIQERKKEMASKLKHSKINKDDDEDDIGLKQKKPFLDLLLEYNINDDIGMTDSDLRMQVDTFLVAGSHTVQSTASFCLYLLSQHQDVQEKVYEEMQHIFGGTERDACYQDLLDMKYLDKVIKETLRMYPAAQYTARITYEDIKLRSGLIIPKDTSLMILIGALHVDPEVYPDPLKFDPERFDQQATSAYTFLPFGGGLRHCIGQKHAMVEMKSIISRVVRTTKLLPSDIPIQLCFETLVLTSKTGINLRVEPRS